MQTSNMAGSLENARCILKLQMKGYPKGNVIENALYNWIDFAIDKHIFIYSEGKQTESLQSELKDNPNVIFSLTEPDILMHILLILKKRK